MVSPLGALPSNHAPTLVSPEVGRNPSLRALAWAGAVCYALTAAPVGGLAVYAKLRWMELGGFMVAGRNLGRPGLNDFDLWEKLSFFRCDILVVGAVFPALLVLVVRVCRPRFRPLVAALVCAVAACLFYVQIKALDSVGTFLDYHMLLAAARFATQKPTLISPYVEVSGLIKLVAVILLTVLVAAMAGRLDPQRARGRPPVRAPRAVSALALGTVLLGSIVSWIPRLPATRFHRSMFADALAAYWAPGEGDLREFESMTAADLVPSYRDIAGIPRSARDPRFWGEAVDYDVLFFVLETAPARCIDAAPVDLAGVAQLRRRSFVHDQHYSTYPYTSFALFSLFSSWYLPGFARSLVDMYPNAQVPGLIRSLRNRGYRTAIYAPYRARFENDEQMYRMLGFEDQVYPGSVAGGAAGAEWQRVAADDLAALHLLASDISRWLQRDQRFAAVFLPQLGHAPWPDVAGGSRDLTARCRRLVGMQDAWLGALLDTLARHTRLGRTIIVVTGDHGVRTREEDPAFEGGKVDEYSFRVPLLIYAPGVLDRPMRIEHITSHIDVAPTLLDLLGVDSGREFEQGNAIWDPRMAGRTTFFFAREYLGADAYHTQGSFAGWNHVQNVVYRAEGRLHFESGDVVPADSPIHQAVTSFIHRMAGLQRAWIRKLLAGQR